MQDDPIPHALANNAVQSHVAVLQVAKCDIRVIVILVINYLIYACDDAQKQILKDHDSAKA